MSGGGEPGPRGIRVLVPGAGPYLDDMAQHVRRLQEDGRQVLFVTAEHRYSDLHGALARHGVDMDRFACIDVISPPADEGGDNGVRYLASPTLLERIALRTEQWSRTLGSDVHVVLDSLNGLARHNHPRDVQEFAHYIGSRLRATSMDADLVVCRDEDDVLLDLVEAMADRRLDLDAARFVGADGVRAFGSSASPSNPVGPPP